MSRYSRLWHSIPDDFKRELTLVKRTASGEDDYNRTTYDEDLITVTGIFQHQPGPDREAEPGGVKPTSQARIFLPLDIKKLNGSASIDFSQDPGLFFTADAQTRRDWNQPGESWNGNFVRRLSTNPWAYLPIGLELSDEDALAFSLRMTITAADVGGFAVIGLHHDPTFKIAPDQENLLGIYIFRDINPQYLIKAVIWPSIGGLISGTVITVPDAGGDEDLDLSVDWNPSTREMTLTISEHGGPLIGQVVDVIPVDVHFQVSVFGTRDGMAESDDALESQIDDVTIPQASDVEIGYDDQFIVDGQRYAQTQAPYRHSLQQEMLVQEVFPDA